MKEKAQIRIVCENDGVTHRIGWEVTGFESIFEVLGLISKMKNEYLKAMDSRDKEVNIDTSVTIDTSLQN